MVRLTLRVLFLLFLFTLLSLPCLAQFPLGAQQQRPPSDQEIKMQREQAKKLNKERHENLKKDTDKLLELAKQLKQYVDKSNEDILSVDVIKKCNQIEKLAHSVGRKMKGY